MGKFKVNNELPKIIVIRGQEYVFFQLNKTRRHHLWNHILDIWTTSSSSSILSCCLRD